MEKRAQSSARNTKSGGRRREKEGQRRGDARMRKAGGAIKGVWRKKRKNKASLRKTIGGTKWSKGGSHQHAGCWIGRPKKLSI